MASIGDVILKLVVDNTDLKAKLDAAQGHIATFEKQSTSRFANIGNMFLKMFGGVMLVRQLAMMVAQMDEVNGALEKMKAQATYMFEETIRPGLPYIIGGIDLVGKALRGLLAVLKLVGSHMGSMAYLWYTLFTNPKGLKDAIAAYKENMKAAWDDTLKIFDESGKATPTKSLPKKEIKALKDTEKEYAAALNKFYKPYEDLRQDRLRKMKDEHDQRIKAEKDTADKIQKEYERIYGLVNARVDDFVDALAKSLNGEVDAWKNWADSIIQEIERVLLKKALLAGLDWLSGGTGFISNAAKWLMGNGSQSSPGPNIQIITADPATVVRVVNRAYGRAPAGEQARLAQVVGRGAVANVRR